MARVGRLKERPRQAFTPKLCMLQLVPVFAPQAPLKLPETLKDASAGSRTPLKRLPSFFWTPREVFSPPAGLCACVVLQLALCRKKIRAKLQMILPPWMPRTEPPASSYEGLTSNIKLAPRDRDQGPGTQAGTRDPGPKLGPGTRDQGRTRDQGPGTKARTRDQKHRNRIRR